MIESTNIRRSIGRRLLPLYAAAFFQSFVLWYTIEKLFMHSIGFNDAIIGVSVAIYSAVMLAVETPSGILADRWSRKGVLILSSLALAVSCLIAGFSHSVPIFIVSSMFWGVSYALYSGTYDSITYDAVYEATGSSRRFEYFYGRIRLLESLGLVISSIAGGAIANQFGLRAPFFLSIIAAVLAIISLLLFREPQLHKAAATLPIKKQLHKTFQATLRNPHTLPLVIVLMLSTVILETLYEFSQLWLIALATPALYFGFANAAILMSPGLGGAIASRLQLQRLPVILPIVITMAIASFGLISLRTTPLIVAAQVVLGTGVVAVSVLFTKLLHDELTSDVRAGTASAVSTLSRCIIIPLAILFGYLSRQYSIYAAAILFFGLTICLSAYVIRIALRNGGRGLDSKMLDRAEPDSL